MVLAYTKINSAIDMHKQKLSRIDGFILYAMFVTHICTLSLYIYSISMIFYLLISMGKKMNESNKFVGLSIAIKIFTFLWQNVNKFK